MIGLKEMFSDPQKMFLRCKVKLLARLWKSTEPRTCGLKKIIFKFRNKFKER